MRPARITTSEIARGAVARQAMARLVVETAGPGFVDVTAEVEAVVAGSGIATGLAVLFCRHTSASLTIQENADPDVLRDLGAALDRFAPADGRYVHAAEGPDDMPAHIRAMLTDTSLTIPVVAGELGLGRWQGVYLVEHRRHPHRREIVVTVSGG